MLVPFIKRLRRIHQATELKKNHIIEKQEKKISDKSSWNKNKNTKNRNKTFKIKGKWFQGL
jgi:hypothetical protein